jgi:AAA+ ATPase superfamily predicted ATPase
MVTKSIVDQLIGRKYEKEELHNIMESTKAEFVGVYGRRRVGKTFLIRTFLNQKKYTFLSYQGQKGIDYKTQIDTFYDEVEKQFELEYQIKRSKNWQGAFKDLNDFMIKNISKKIVLFFDELPWFCAPKSGFLPALDYYWNQHWSKNKKIKLIVCGSSASWMIKNIVNAKGGLHNRLTRKMYVAPFQYNETKEYSIKHKLKLTDTQLLQLYMIFGGVPFYWSLLKKEAPISKQIDQLLFKNHIPFSF